MIEPAVRRNQPSKQAAGMRRRNAILLQIYDYFRNEAESDSIADALRELGPDFTEEEVRLVRIKFLCEVSN